MEYECKYQRTASDKFLIPIFSLTLILLCVLGFMVLRMAITVNRVCDNVEDVASRVETLVKTTDTIKSALDAMNDFADEFSVITDDAGKNSVKHNPKAKQEIKILFSRLLSVAKKYEYNGNQTKTLTFYLQLKTKYKVYEKTLTSADEFIERVATKTIAGNTYYAILKDDSKVELGPLLKKELEAYRKSKSE